MREIREEEHRRRTRSADGQIFYQNGTTTFPHSQRETEEQIRSLLDNMDMTSLRRSLRGIIDEATKDLREKLDTLTAAAPRQDDDGPLGPVELIDDNTDNGDDGDVSSFHI